jgi:hypothetical protein
MTERNWTYEKHATKYPDLFTYQILQPNEDYGKAGTFSQHIKQFGVCDLDSEEDTKLIVKAVNNHDKLVEALKAIRRGLEQDIKIHDSTFGDGTFIRDKDVKEYIDSITDVLDFTQ